MIERLSVHDVAVPLRRPFRTAAGVLTTRRTILVGLGVGDVVGWGEAAPYSGAAIGDADAAWEALTARRPERVPIARAAWSEAEADLAARVVGRSLRAEIGADPGPVVASLAVGLEDPVADVDAAVALGYTAVKLKIAPGSDLEVVSAIRRRHPGLAVGVDANGAYRPGRLEPPAALAEYVAYLEQPYPPGCEEAAALLRRRGFRVAFDESVTSPTTARRLLEGGWADLLVVKPGRLGWDGALDVARAAADAGVGIRASGLVETGIGRAFVAALGALPHAGISDVACADHLLAVDPVRPACRLVDGRIEVADGPGIGVEPFLDDVEVIRSVEVAVR